MADTRQYRELGAYATAGTLLVRDRLISPGGGAGVTITPPFIYTATGAENPAGFSVPFPTGARGGEPYVASIQFADGANFNIYNAPPGSYADDHIIVVSQGVLTAGDKISVIIADR